MEFIIFAVLLIIVIIVWGLASISQSYAAAKQAQATIEVARTAQISSTANLVTILTVVLVILALLALVGVGLWLFYRLRIKPVLTRAGMLPGSSNNRRLLGGPAAQNSQALSQQDPLGLLTQMMAFQMYQQMQTDLRHRQQDQYAPPDDGDDQWLLPL